MNKTTYEQELAEKGRLIYTTVGRSMRPFLRSGEDMVIIESTGNQRFSPRDVVLYRRKSGKYVLHRIMAVRREDYILCGDNCWNLEPGIRDDQILGVLTAVIRNGRRIDVKGRSYRSKVFAWWLLYPIRACLFYVRELIGKIWVKIKKSVS